MTSNVTRLRWSVCLVLNSEWTCTEAVILWPHQVTVVTTASACTVDSKFLPAWWNSKQAQNKHLRYCSSWSAGICHRRQNARDAHLNLRFIEMQMTCWLSLTLLQQLIPTQPKPDYLCIFFLFSSWIQLGEKAIPPLNLPQSIISRWALTLNNGTHLMVILCRSH